MNIDAKTALDVAAFLPKALEAARRVWGKVTNSIDGSIRKSHLDYACSVISKYSRAKTFLIRSEPQYLYDFYVPSSVHKRGGGRIDQVDLSKLEDISARLIVTGGGGSGKTVLMRHLLLDALAKADNFPILVELRNLNDDSQKTLGSEILDVLSRHGFNMPEEFTQEYLKSGLFVLLLDGYDEVQHARRKSLEREIRRLADSCSCQIVITSRYDTALESWDRFTNVEISPLTLEEACELVEKARFDEDIKASFGAKLRGGLFSSHSFFLSNPLLLSIMLLTYGDTADIPKKLSTFYLQAYEALFHGHDALKASFKRDRKTNLDIYEFARIFSGLSILSYEKRAFSFSKTDAIKYVRDASDLTGICSFDVQGFVDDARQAVCLLVDDGLELSFSHRSFQEFFAAKFISESPPDLQKRIIEKITKKSVSIDVDSVISILHEIDPVVVEKYFLIPALGKLFGQFDKVKVSKSRWYKFFCDNFDEIALDKEDDLIWVRVSEDGRGDHRLIAFVAGRYFDEEFQESRRRLWVKGSRDFADKYFNGEHFRMDVSNLTVNSKMTSDLSKVLSIYSVDGLEKVRCCLKEMKDRSMVRASVLDKVFC